MEEVATLAENEAGLAPLHRFVAEQFKGFSPSAGHKLLPLFRWKAIFTLNYDRLVEDSYTAQSKRLQNLIAFHRDQNSIEKELVSVPDALPYFKLHGSIDHLYESDAPLILTTSSYVDFESNRRRLFRRLEDLAVEYPIVFIGTRLGDPHIKAILAAVEKGAGSSRPMYYFVSPGINQFDTALLAARRMSPVQASFGDFMARLEQDIPKVSRILSAALPQSGSSIERHFRRNVPAPPALSAFLKDNVEHVREGMPTSTVSAELFYKGESQSWAPIQQSFDIERTLYSTLVLRVLGLDKAEETINLITIRGVAGSGKTVLMRRVAHDLATKYDKLVLFAPPGAILRADPLIELHELTGLPVILVVDHAADQVPSLEPMLERLQAVGIPIIAILGDTHAAFGNTLEPLSDRIRYGHEVRNLDDMEIEALISKLDQNGSLGLLANEPPDVRKKAFTELADKQLLVALYEATQGRLLEDLLVVEYHRVLLTEAQELYLLVCTLNRFRVPIRATLVHRIMGISFKDFEKRFLGPLQGMVFTEMDPASRDYAYRARHPQIADIVFRRILDSQSKQVAQYKKMIEHMNTSYTSDNAALRKMLSFKNLRDVAGHIEDRRSILEAAERISGNDTFILQQQAITEINSNRGDLKAAADYLARAQVLRPNDKTIFHTRASLLTRKAEQTKDVLSRRSLRSEARAILKATRDGDSDPYVCSLLARVAIDEIQDRLKAIIDLPNDGAKAEIARLTEDAQKAIAKGLSRAPDFEGLIKENYRLRRVLQIGDRGIGMLERTLDSQPGLEFVAATYARALASSDPEKAKAALRKGIAEKPHSKILHQALFELLLAEADDFRDELAAPLRRAYTPEDDNLLMHLHSARFHYVRGERAEYASALGRLEKMKVQMPEKLKPRLPVKNAASSKGLFAGTIVQLRVAYGFIETPGFLDRIFLRSAGCADELVWEKLREGSQVSYQLRFNGRGAVATEVRLAAGLA
ncbi:SIR2 family protein [Mesorhizobium sp. M0676]|uniref:P-loop NTPase n=1 Tax=Mesorhizobium sp. M0676 TaxID=2956984 RepID=UPI003336092F